MGYCPQQHNNNCEKIEAVEAIKRRFVSSKCQACFAMKCHDMENKQLRITLKFKHIQNNLVKLYCLSLFITTDPNKKPTSKTQSPCERQSVKCFGLF